jgi:transposase-like protein
MNYLLCALVYVATIAVILYGFSKLRRTCPTCKGTGISQNGISQNGLCRTCQWEGKL